MNEKTVSHHCSTKILMRKRCKNECLAGKHDSYLSVYGYGVSKSSVFTNWLMLFCLFTHNLVISQSKDFLLLDCNKVIHLPYQELDSKQKNLIPHAKRFNIS